MRRLCVSKQAVLGACLLVLVVSLLGRAVPAEAAGSGFAPAWLADAGLEDPDLATEVLVSWLEAGTGWGAECDGSVPRGLAGRGGGRSC